MAHPFAGSPALSLRTEWTTAAGASQHRPMREWGTQVSVADEASAEVHFAQLRARFPDEKSAYRPSGKLPLSGLAALAGGGMIASVVAALTGVVLAGISLVLFAIMGFVIALIAVCGFVVCITLVWGLGVAVVGGGATFGGLGWVAGALTAWFGRLGKNRNVTAAIVVGFLATLVAWAMLAILPPLVASVVPPSAEDFSVGGLVHLFGDYGWVHYGVLVVGLLFALLMAFIGAEDTVNAQKFCESCELFMVDKRLCATNLETGAHVIACVRAGDAVGAVDVLTGDTGSDLEPTLHRCPKCGAGILEARLWTRARWVDAKGAKDAVRDWLVLSSTLSPELTLPLSRLPDRKDD